jgi:hypothetical protein
MTEIKYLVMSVQIFVKSNLVEMVLCKHLSVNNVMMQIIRIWIHVPILVCFVDVVMVLYNEQSNVINDVFVMIEMVLHELIVPLIHGFVLAIVNLVSVMGVRQVVMLAIVVIDTEMLMVQEIYLEMLMMKCVIHENDVQMVFIVDTILDFVLVNVLPDGHRLVHNTVKTRIVEMDL